MTRPRIRRKAADPDKPPKAKKAKPLDGMTDIERAYSLHLARRVADGEIRKWELQAIRLKIIDAVPGDADRGIKPIPASWYKPDFLVTENDGTYSTHETKGRFEDNSFGWLAFKSAASRHPFPTYFVTLDGERWKTEGGVKRLIAGEWIITRYGR